MKDLKSLAINCGPLSEMIRGFALKEQLMGALQDRLDVRLRHRLSDLPVNDVATVAVENRAQVVECPADIQVRNIDMPVFVRSAGLFKALPFR